MKRTTPLAAIALLCMLAACDREEADPVPDIDLEASSLAFEIISRNGLEGRVAVRGKVRNNRDHFISGEGQQVAALYEQPIGGQAKLLTKVNFHLMEAGEIIDVATIINWDAAIEFPPDFILRIEYDPDILTDGNKQNDDRNSANNALIKSGSEISALFSN